MLAPKVIDEEAMSVAPFSMVNLELSPVNVHDAAVVIVCGLVPPCPLPCTTKYLPGAVKSFAMAATPVPSLFVFQLPGVSGAALDVE